MLHRRLLPRWAVLPNRRPTEPTRIANRERRAVPSRVTALSAPSRTKDGFPRRYLAPSVSKAGLSWLDRPAGCDPKRCCDAILAAYNAFRADEPAEGCNGTLHICNSRDGFRSG